MDAQTVLGIAAALVALSAFPVYIVDVLHGHTRPNTATWFILTLSGTLIAASYYGSGARDTFWISLSYPLGYLVIAILSLRYGYSKWNGLDKVCLTLALLSTVGWLVFKSPQTTFIINVGIDFLGILPTIYKTYRKPSTESRSAWILDVIASVLAILAIDQWNFFVALYPLYLLATNGIIVIFIFRKKYSWRLNDRV